MQLGDVVPHLVHQGHRVHVLPVLHPAGRLPALAMGFRGQCLYSPPRLLKRQTASAQRRRDYRDSIGHQEGRGGNPVHKEDVVVLLTCQEDCFGMQLGRVSTVRCDPEDSYEVNATVEHQ